MTSCRGEHIPLGPTSSSDDSRSTGSPTHARSSNDRQSVLAQAEIESKLESSFTQFSVKRCNKAH